MRDNFPCSEGVPVVLSMVVVADNGLELDLEINGNGSGLK